MGGKWWEHEIRDRIFGRRKAVQESVHGGHVFSLKPFFLENTTFPFPRSTEINTAYESYDGMSSLELLGSL